MRVFASAAILGSSFMILACASYKQNLMFQAAEGFPFHPAPLAASEEGLQILPNDLLTVEVFTNSGERIIDPNPELTNPDQLRTERREFSYLVDDAGLVKLPLVGAVKLSGMNLRQAEAVVQEEYQQYYKDPYVIIKFNNKRVILLGALGGQVIPLENPNMKLTEVLALGKGLESNAKANDIRVMRGDKVFHIDLSTLEGFRAGDMVMQSGDIVYVEPVRRPFTEAIRENSSILGLFVSLASIIVVIITVTR